MYPIEVTVEDSTKETRKRKIYINICKYRYVTCWLPTEGYNVVGKFVQWTKHTQKIDRLFY